MSSVEEAYAEVQRVTRARAKNFAYGIMVLPREKRRAIAAIYAFAREVDDIADGSAPIDEIECGGEPGEAAAHDRDFQRHIPRATTASFARVESRHDAVKTSKAFASMRSSWPR